MGRRKLNVKPTNQYICDNFSIFHTNVCGLQSKLESLKSIVSAITPSVITINETNLKKAKKLNVDGYTCYNRNRKDAHMGGIATCTKNCDSVNVLKVAEGDENNEYLVT